MVANGTLKITKFENIFTFLFFLQWVLCLPPVESIAQATDISRSVLYWTRYYQEWAITEKFQLHREIDNRRFFQPSKQFQTIARTTFVMKLPDEIKLGPGISYSLEFCDLSSLVVPEIRPHQQIEVGHGKSRLKFDHRIRVEQPFVRDTVREELQSSYDFTSRGRYRFRLVYTV